MNVIIIALIGLIVIGYFATQNKSRLHSDEHHAHAQGFIATTKQSDSTHVADGDDDTLGTLKMKLRKKERELMHSQQAKERAERKVERLQIELENLSRISGVSKRTQQLYTENKEDDYHTQQIHQLEKQLSHIEQLLLEEFTDTDEVFKIIVHSEVAAQYLAQKKIYKIDEWDSRLKFYQLWSQMYEVDGNKPRALANFLRHMCVFKELSYKNGDDLILDEHEFEMWKELELWTQEEGLIEFVPEGAAFNQAVVTDIEVEVASEQVMFSQVIKVYSPRYRNEGIRALVKGQ